MNPSEPPPFPKQDTPVILPDPSEFAELNTERLTLRLLRVDNDEDAAGLFRIRSQPEVMNWMYAYRAHQCPCPCPRPLPVYILLIRV